MGFIEKAKRFFEPLWDNKWLTFLSCIKFGLYGVHAIFSVIILRASLKAIERGDIEGFNANIEIFIILIFFYFLISWILRTSDWPGLYHRLERWIYRRYIPKIIELDNNYMESIGTGRLISIVGDGRTRWVDQLIFFLEEFSKIAITGGFLVYLISQINLSYAVLLVLSLIGMQTFVIYVDIIAHKDRRKRTVEKGELTRKLVRIIMGKYEILQNNQVSKELGSVESSVSTMDSINNRINRSMFFIFNFVRLFAFLLRIIILFIVGLGVFRNEFTVSEFATIMAMIIVFESFLFDSTEFYKNFTKDFSDIEKLWEVIDKGPVMKGYDTGNTFSKKESDIEIDSISFGYNESRVFQEFSLTIKRGLKTALVGASGGGKTTLMKLIAGYLHPDSGHISILGNRLDETALKTYYPHIGYLTQDPGVFDATIRENLVSALSSFGKELPTRNEDAEDFTQQKVSPTPLSKEGSDTVEQKLIQALKLAHCDFVFELEKGIDTEIGERGVRLSGGQKQRLAIAKIFLKNPEIVLLDEPTSALDSFSEEHITKALDELFKGRTVIVVAHRLQTVKKADDIIVIEGGKVVERGDHAELVKKGGIYNRMLELQSGF